MIRIDSRRDYELYVTGLLTKNFKLTKTIKKLMVSIAMQSFDDGVSFALLDLKVNVDYPT